MRHARGFTLGFTLIEVMIVVVIIGILATIAWPSYNAYLARSRRSDAQSLMLSIVNKEQQYLLDARQYTATVGTGGLGIASQGWNCSSIATACSNAYYAVTVTLTAGPPPGFTVVGTPVGSQLDANDGTLNFVSTGSKTRMVGATDKGW